MASSERPPRRSPDPLADDPLAGAFPVRRSVPAFLLSVSFHAALFLALATVSLVVVQREERIRVKVFEPQQALEEEADVEGAPSLQDLAGVLRPQITRPRTAGSVAGPSTSAPVAAVRAPEMPRIAGVGPSIGQSPGTLDIPLSIGGGGLVGSGLGAGGFGDVLGSLRKVGIDLVLLIDTTNSMQPVIDEVKEQVRSFIGNLQEMVPASRVAVVAYRDKGDEYVTKWVDFSFHTEKVQNFVAGLRADGGGDWPEAVRSAIEAANTELKWRKTARRIMIIIGSSPPQVADRPEIQRLVREFRDKNGAVSAVDVSARMHEEWDRAEWILHGQKGEFKVTPLPAFYGEVRDAYADIAKQGGGEMLSLGQNKALLREVMIVTFGTRWRVEMARFMDRLQ